LLILPWNFPYFRITKIIRPFLSTKGIWQGLPFQINSLGLPFYLILVGGKLGLFNFLGFLGETMVFTGNLTLVRAIKPKLLIWAKKQGRLLN